MSRNHKIACRESRRKAVLSAQEERAEAKKIVLIYLGAAIFWGIVFAFAFSSLWLPAVTAMASR